MAEIRYQLQGSAPQRYEKNNVPRLLRPQAEAMLDQVSLHSGDRVLDVACGTGIVTRVAVERCPDLASVMGLDFNSGMLEIAQENTPQVDIPIEWQQGDMCNLTFPDDSFDMILSQQGVQFAPDKLLALRHMRRVLVSGGRLAFTVWSEVDPLKAATVETARRHVHDEAANDILSANDWAETDIEKLVNEAEFHGISIQVIESVMRWPSSEDEVASFIANLAARSEFTNDIESAIAVMTQEVRTALQSYLEDDDFVMPARSYLVQAKK